jgi:signal transduction histidine kinase
MEKIIKDSWSALINLGVQDSFSTYEKGLVKLTNKAALLILIIVNLVLLPVALFSKLTTPILIINSVFFPITLYLNQQGHYKAAKHYLLALLYFMLILISVYRGLESGILFITIPSLLLAFIFFPKQQSLNLHLGILGSLILFTLAYLYSYLPIAPYAPDTLRYVYPLHLGIGIVLSLVFINFFFRVSREYQRELAELNHTKNKLLSIIGHDLKGPLNSLKGVLQLLNNKHISQEEFYMLSGNLQQSTENLHSSLNNLLQWALSQMKGIQPKPARVNLSKLVQELEGLFAETARHKQIRLLNTLPPELEVFCDPDQVQLVVRNLLSNALKFSAEGLRIQVYAEAINEQYLEISVADEGTGIPPEVLKNLFTPDISNSRKGTKGESGTGLGLLLCKEMVEKNGGSLRVSSTPGKGSTFTFSLPRPLSAAPAMADSVLTA